MDPIPAVTFAGSPEAIGRAHGRAFADDIRRFAAERLELACGPLYTGHTLSRRRILAIAEACLDAHLAYSPELTGEMRGMAEATGISMPEALIAGGFTDFVDTVSALGGRHESADASAIGRRLISPGMPGQFQAGAGPTRRSSPLRRAARRFVDDCTAFLVPDGDAEGAGFIGQTWDMHATAAEHVFLMRIEPDQGPRAVIFTSQGCLGMIGMNEAGLAVGINNLAGGDGQIGVTWPFVIREMLRQQTADEAVDAIRRAPLAGAHNYLIMDSGGQGYNVEAMSTHLGISALDGVPIAHTNHCLLPPTRALERERLPAQIAASELRLNVAGDILGAAHRSGAAVTADDLMALTREPSAICVLPVAPKYVATCGAVIMRPKTGELWAVAGLPTEGEFVRVVV